MEFGDLLVTGAAWALGLGAVWALLICAAAILEVTSSGRLAFTGRLGCPAPARRALLAGLGVALASGGGVVAGPVAARSGPPDLPVPARPIGSAYPPPRQRVVVEPGDSLWRLAQTHSSARATTQDLARLVGRTYRTNRRVIGPDPDLIQPGQRLHIPAQRPHTPPHLETP